MGMQGSREMAAPAAASVTSETYQGRPLKSRSLTDVVQKGSSGMCSHSFLYYYLINLKQYLLFNKFDVLAANEPDRFNLFPKQFAILFTSLDQYDSISPGGMCEPGRQRHSYIHGESGKF